MMKRGQLTCRIDSRSAEWSVCLPEFGVTISGSDRGRVLLAELALRCGFESLLGTVRRCVSAIQGIAARISSGVRLDV
jgi:hypothetical protein